MSSVGWRRAFVLAACLGPAACSSSVDGTAPATSPSSTTTTSSATTSTTSSTSTTAASTTSTSTTTSTTSTTTSTTTTTTSTTITTTSTTTTTAPAAPTTTVAPPPSPDGLPVATLPPTWPATSGSAIWQVRPASGIAPPPIPDGWSVASLGTSHLGRSIDVWSRVPADATREIIVVGGIHGNEPVSPPVVRALVDVDYPDDVAIWLVPLLNPDGSAGGTRSNGVGVDLNRNFGWEWWPSDGGDAPFSEPESAAIAGLIGDVRPDVVVWVHQPLGYVSSIGATPDAYEQAWSRGSGLPVRVDVTQHGGGESWTSLSAGIPSMLVEVDSWAATPEIVAAQRNGFIELLSVVG